MQTLPHIGIRDWVVLSIFVLPYLIEFSFYVASNMVEAYWKMRVRFHYAREVAFRDYQQRMEKERAH